MLKWPPGFALMSETQVSTELLCRQCAAVLPVEPGDKYTTCEYCGTVNYVDKSEAVLHFAVRPTLDEGQATSALRRWMAGNQTVKGLDAEAKIESHQFQLFPMWMVRTVTPDHEEVQMKPAAAVSIVELAKLRVPAADLEPYAKEMDVEAIKPTVPISAVHGWLGQNEGIAANAIAEISLVHVPIYQFKYRYKEESYLALVDGAAGQVFAAIYPEKFELPYLTIGGVGCIAYFLAALIPLISYSIFDGGEGIAIGSVIYLAVSLGLAIPIFLAAAAVSRRY